MITKNNILVFIATVLAILVGVMTTMIYQRDHPKVTTVVPMVEPPLVSTHTAAEVAPQNALDNTGGGTTNSGTDPLTTELFMVKCLNGDKSFRIAIDEYVNRKSSTPVNETYSITNKGEPTSYETSMTRPIKGGGYRFLSNNKTPSDDDMIMVPTDKKGNYILHTGSNDLVCTENGAMFL
jgi:hypothetical protein